MKYSGEEKYAVSLFQKLSTTRLPLTPRSVTGEPTQPAEMSSGAGLPSVSFPEFINSRSRSCATAGIIPAINAAAASARIAIFVLISSIPSEHPILQPGENIAQDLGECLRK